jgi:mRNA interferase HigB
MHIISRKALQLFIRFHPDSKSPLDAWFRILSTHKFESFHALRQVFPSADMVGNLVVFNISGNKYRLIAAIHFNRQKLYIRDVLTHAEYDKERWKK